MDILKASAGSGKTFSLTGKYLSLLFSKRDKYAYRHILAVTFTNKATDEMKTRIMKELFTLATEPEKSAYKDDLIASLGGTMTVASLGQAAQDLLCNMLHDYGSFAVSTIDKFFQQTLRAFSHEIGQFASYQVELDRNSLINESVDRVLDSLTENDTMILNWLTDSVMETLEQGQGYGLDGPLKDMAKRLKSVEHTALVEKLGINEGEVYSRENLAKIRKACRAAVTDFENRARNLAGEVLDGIEQAGLTQNDFAQNFPKYLLGYRDLKSGAAVSAPSSYLMQYGPEPSTWLKPKLKNREELLSLVEPLIEQPLREFVELFGLDFTVYNTAKILQKQLYSLGVAADLYREFNALMKEKNVLSLDDSNTILKGIIDGSDAPFIYEKTGVRYENFLLDEFQDTSSVQWDNFLPLLKESEANGFENLIVGDVKQSIYRWRGSDWNLLDSEVEAEFPEAETDTLDTNWRSCNNIIAFNNELFPVAAAILDKTLGDVPGRTLAEMYGDVRQKMPPKTKGAGEVSLAFCSKDEETSKVLETIDMLVSKGVGYGEMAVIVRTNNSGARIAQALIDRDVPVITDDSLDVKASVTVRRLTSLLSYVDNPADTVNGYLAQTLDIELPKNCHSLQDTCEALLRGLRDADPVVFDSEVLYIQSFMDRLQDYVSVNGNNLHDFLASWAEAQAYIASPDAGESVRIITVHKAKGLAFKYVIFPYIEDVRLYKPGLKWCSPDLKGTALEEASDGLFDISLSSGSDSTVFAGDYHREMKMQYADNINVVYVALTRPVKGLYMIAEAPTDKFKSSLSKGSMPNISTFAQVLYVFAQAAAGRPGALVAIKELGQELRAVVPEGCPLMPSFEYVDEGGVELFHAGETPAGQALGQTSTGPASGQSLSDQTSGQASGQASGRSSAGQSEGEGQVRKMSSGYPSWPLNPDPDEEDGEAGERGRLKFRTDAADFFSDEGLAGTEASVRVKGIVLHDILSRVESAEELEKAVEASFNDGVLDRAGAHEALELLSARLKSATERGWFPGGSDGASEGQTPRPGTAQAVHGGIVKVLKEKSLIDTDGSLLRPDRVITYADGSLLIIDYKFGVRDECTERKYVRQVRRYADIWRRMGHSDVSALLWYVTEDEIVPV